MDILTFDSDQDLDLISILAAAYNALPNPLSSAFFIYLFSFIAKGISDGEVAHAHSHMHVSTRSPSFFFDPTNCDPHEKGNDC